MQKVTINLANLTNSHLIVEHKDGTLTIRGANAEEVSYPQTAFYLEGEHITLQDLSWHDVTIIPPREEIAQRLRENNRTLKELSRKMKEIRKKYRIDI